MSLDRNQQVRLECVKLAAMKLSDTQMVIETAKAFANYIIGDNAQAPSADTGGGDPILPGTSGNAPRVRRGRPPGSARKPLE